MSTPKHTTKILSLLILLTLFLSLFTNVQAQTTFNTLNITTETTFITPNITAETAILIDSSSGKVLYDKNAEQKMYPASTTKILTAILTLEHCRLNDVVTVPYDAIRIIPAGYAVAALQPGEELTVGQLLKLMMVHSANDAANVLAFHISGSIESFADLMNEKLAEIGLTHTHFTNPSGMHNENHYSTAHDLALLMQYGMKDNTFRNFAGLKSCTIPATNKYEERVFNTTNELLLKDTRNVASNYYYPYAVAGKTGYTTQAKNCLVSVANKDGFELICVVLGVGLYDNGLSAKFIESKSLFEYGYEEYTIQKLREQGAIGTQMDVINGTKETRSLDLLLAQDITVLVKQSEMNQERTPTISLTENLMAPIAQGQKIGTISYDIDGVSYTSDLVAAHSVEPSTLFPILIQIGLFLIVLVLLYFLISSGHKKGGKKRKKKKVHRLY